MNTAGVNPQVNMMNTAGGNPQVNMMNGPVNNMALKPARTEMEDVTPVEKAYSRMGFALAIWTVLFMGTVIGLTLLLGKVFPELSKNNIYTLLKGTLPIYLFIPVILLVAKGLPKTIKPEGNIKKSFYLSIIPMCYTFMIAGNMIGLVLQTIVKMITGGETRNTTVNLVLSSNPVIIITLVVVIGPFFEEFVFRKILLDKLSGYNEMIAILMSGLLFGLFHMNFYQLFYAMAIGILFAVVYTKTGKIVYNWILHMIFNFMGGMIPALLSSKMEISQFQRFLIEMSTTTDSAKSAELLQEFFSNPIYLCYMGLSFFNMGMAVLGLVLLVINFRKFIIPSSGPAIPKGKRLTSTLLTVGMIVYIILLLGLTVFEMMMGTK